MIVIKLYCAKFRNKSDEVIDIVHMLGNNNKEIRYRLDKTLEKCSFYGVEEYNSYSFFEVSEVDDINLSEVINSVNLDVFKIKNGLDTSL